MTKNIPTIVVIVVAVLVLVGLTGYAVYRDQQQPVVTDTALAAANQRYTLASAQAAKSSNDLVAANGTVTILTTQKATLCVQIKAAKLVQPLCP